jgi:hypothetical protein
MQTRSQTRSQVQVSVKEPVKEHVKVKESVKEPVNKHVKEPLQLYEVDIDFDDASEAWRANKKSIGNGQYKYIRVKKSK